MKRASLVLILFVFIINSYGKEFNPDSTVVLAKTGYFTKRIDSVNVENCYKSDPKNMLLDELLIICSVKECPSSYRKTQLFEVISEGEVFYVEKDRIEILEDDDYYEKIKDLPDTAKVKFRERSLLIGHLVHLEKQKEALRKQENVLKFIESCKPKGLVMISWRVFDVSEYTDGTGIEFDVLNPTNKTIKYIWFTVRGMNAVDDPVRAKDGNFSITLKGIGPIKPDENASYSWDYVWFTDIVEYGRIISIKVQYMDGTFKTIENVKSITFTPEMRDILMNY